MKSKCISKFLKAQDAIYEHVLCDLKTQERNHCWLWFIFPQLRGLGTSKKSIKYGLSGIDEVQILLSDRTLSLRIYECTNLLLSIPQDELEDFCGYSDLGKIQAFATLFHCATEDSLFDKILEKYFHGERHKQTLSLLGK